MATSFDEIFTEPVVKAIGIGTDANRLDVDAFKDALVDRLSGVIDDKPGEINLVAEYIAENWPEEYRLDTALRAVPWVSVLKSIDVNDLSTWVYENGDFLGDKPIGRSTSQKTMGDQTTATAFIVRLASELRTQYEENAAQNISASDPTVQPDEALTDAQSLADQSLSDIVGTAEMEMPTIESRLAVDPNQQLSSLVEQNLEFEKPLDLSDLPGFASLDVSDQFTAEETLSYIVEIDQNARKKLQDIMADAGYFDTARSMGHISAFDGTMDTATHVAWQEFLADAVLNQQPNVEEWLRGRMRSMGERSMAGVQEVYRDPAEINALIDNMSFNLVGRIIEPTERQSLLAKLKEWQQEALLGPTYSQERYDVDLQARAKEYFDKTFIKERMANRRDMFREMIGEFGG
jgi:hypothetical protein